MQLFESDYMLNLENYVKITALTGFRAKLGGMNSEDDILMLLRVINYTSHVSSVQDDMQKDSNLSEDIRRTILKELDITLAAEGF